MGQKVNPNGFRLAYNRGWESSWFMADKKGFARNVLEDHKIRKYIRKYYKDAFISKVQIEKRDGGNSIIINILAEKPGYLIGKGGEEIETLIQNLEYETGKKVAINISELQNPDCDAEIIAQRIAAQLERRAFFRKAMNDAVQTVMEAGALGVKIIMSGRVGGSEMSRREKLVSGNVPLNTLKADLDYALGEAVTKHGKIGIKVWIHRGFITKRDYQEKIRTKEIMSKENM
ncbi:MAG: 30S ribosomal protein S3 [Planctomycetota bacterium]